MPDSQDAKKDFEPLELSIKTHTEDISSLEAKVAALEQKLKDPDLLAKILEDAVAVSKRLDTLFSKIFCDMMRKDDDVKAAIEAKMAAVDRNALLALLKKGGGVIALGLWTLLTIGLTAWADHHFGSH